MKHCILLICLLLSTNSHAGFITGAVVGSAMSKSTKILPSSETVASDKHSVISCRKVNRGGQFCGTSSSEPASMRCDTHTGPEMCITPAQYAGNAGFKTIFRTAITFHDGNEYIIMEVE